MLELTSYQVLKYIFTKKPISNKKRKNILVPKLRKLICYKTKFNRKRYLYEQRNCEFCDQPLSLYEQDHLMCNCRALKCEPYYKKRRIKLSDDTFKGRHYELAKLKYNKLSLENFNVA